MLSRKVSRLLKALDNKQLKRLKTFLESPYFNTKPELTDLSDALIGIVKRGKDCTEEEAFAVWKGETMYNQTLFRRSCSDLVSLIYTFLTHENLHKEPRIQYLCLLDELMSLEGSPEWHNVYQKALKYYQDEGKFRKYSHAYLLPIEYLFWRYSFFERKNPDAIHILKNIERMVKELSYEYFVDVATMGVSARKVFPKLEGIALSESISKELEKDWPSLPVFLQLSYFAYKLVNFQKEEDYDRLSNILQKTWIAHILSKLKWLSIFA